RCLLDAVWREGIAPPATFPELPVGNWPIIGGQRKRPRCWSARTEEERDGKEIRRRVGGWALPAVPPAVRPVDQAAAAPLSGRRAARRDQCRGCAPVGGRGSCMERSRLEGGRPRSGQLLHPRRAR